MGDLLLCIPRTPQVSEWYQLAQEPPCLKQTTHHAGPHRVRTSYASWPLHAPASPAGCGPQQPPSLVLLRKRAQRPPSTALPTGCQGTGPRPGNVGAPPPLRPHLGSGNKVRRRKKGDTQAGRRVGAMPTAHCPWSPAPWSRNSPKNLPLAGSWLSPPISTTQRGAITCPGSHSRSMNQLLVSQWEGV